MTASPVVSRRTQRRRGSLSRRLASAKDLRLAIPSSNRVAYVGWVGHGNMGDEAIFDVCRRAFPEHRLLAIPHGSTFARAARLSSSPIISGALLGGGTLVGRYSKYRRPFERWLERYPELPAYRARTTLAHGRGRPGPARWVAPAATRGARGASWDQRRRVVSGGSGGR